MTTYPLWQRKERLDHLLKPSFQEEFDIALAAFWSKDHQVVVGEMQRLGFEGVVLKRKQSLYQKGPSRDWLKVKFRKC